MTKLWENTFRAVNIALANELADGCRHFGIEPRPVIEAAATKPYGFMPFYPGPGVGGHCIPCDPHYLLWQLRARRVASPLVDAAMQVIAGRPRLLVSRAGAVLAERGVRMAGARVLLVGLAYKAGVADLRESPALAIADRLCELGAQVSYTDPLVPSAVLGGRMAHSVDEPGARAWDLVVLHTLQPGVRLDWLDAASGAVLDATCGASPAPAPGERAAVIPPPPEDCRVARPVGARPGDVPAGGPA